MVEFNPLAPETIEDPYSLYRRLRTQDPVHRNPAGIWVLSRYDDVVFMLRDSRFARRGFAELIAARFGSPGFARSMLHQDPPDPTRLRALVSKAFSSRGIGDLR